MGCANGSIRARPSKAMATRSRACARCRAAGARRSTLAAKSEFLDETLGKEFLKIFLAIKNQECARFSAEVSELDYAWYLRS